MLFIGIGLISWLDMARIVRGQTLSIKQKEFVEAALATGVSNFTIIIRHIIPNLLGVVAVYATLLVPSMILTESFISFLGLGVQEPNTSWGALISEGASTMSFGALWQSYSKALLSAIPIPNPNIKKKRIILKGDVPSPINPPSGCVFRTRCPNPSHDCKEGNIEMGLIEVNPGHWVDQCCVNCG